MIRQRLRSTAWRVSNPSLRRQADSTNRNSQYRLRPSPRGGPVTTRLLLSIAIAAAFTAGCGGLAESGDAGNGGQCISYLRLGGETYFPVPAEDLPLSDKTMTGEQP